MSAHTHFLPAPSLEGGDVEAKRAEIKHYFQHCYKRYESLFATISDKSACFQKADPLRHPLIFYYGHTAVFFINKFKLTKLIDKRIDPHMESIFAVGVDETSRDDFTVPTFDGKHNLVKGGSWISCGNLADPQSRYAFRKHFYQHAGFRYLESDYEEKIMTNAYTTDTVIAQYCHFGWGENRLGVQNYPETCTKLVLKYMNNRPKRRAFDVGCAIGRSSFELAREFDEVIGVDFSARFILEAQRLKESGILRYALPIEGELEAFYEVRLNKFGLEHASKKVNFWQADACNLKPIFTDFDLVFAGNLIDRLYDPKKFLEDITTRILKGGLLVLTSPYTWQEESTPKEKWIGGYKRDGESIKTIQGLEEILGNDFKLLDTQDVPFVIQETARKHQYTIAQMSVWEKQ